MIVFLQMLYGIETIIKVYQIDDNKYLLLTHHVKIIIGNWKKYFIWTIQFSMMHHRMKEYKITNYKSVISDSSSSFENILKLFSGVTVAI